MRHAILTVSALLAAASAFGPGCFYHLECTDDDTCPPGTGGGSSTTSTGANDGGDSGPQPSCIPSESSAAVLDTCGVFVSSSNGNDTTGKGTKEAPYKTITKALANGTTIYACAGTTSFNEALAIDTPVTLFGALDCATWAYDAASKTQLTAPADAVPLTLASTAGGTEIIDFAITAADAMKDSGSSVAVIANGVMASLTRTDITAGNGKDGLAGTTPTTSVGPLARTSAVRRLSTSASGQ